MTLPQLPEYRRQSRVLVTSFGGINYGQETRDGELEESENLSSRRFPCLSQRRGRRRAGEYRAPTALFARDSLWLVDGTDLVRDGEVVGQVKPGEKQFAAVNTKLVIFPDKVCYDTQTDSLVPLEAELTGWPGDASFTSDSLSFVAGRYLSLPEGESEEILIPRKTELTVWTQAETDKSSGALTMLGGTQKDAARLEAGELIRYGCGEGEYLLVQQARRERGGAVTVLGTRYRSGWYGYPDLDTVFRAGDAVEISGCTAAPGNNGTHIIRSIQGRTLTFDPDVFGQTGSETGQMLLKRRVPDLTCVCECDNRLWGAEGSTVYASALGDPFNFFLFDGLATDSWAAAVGTAGEFTGCIPYGSSVMFFKEDCVHKVLGGYPAQYELCTYSVPGIQAGSGKSAVNVNETLFYLGRGGVYAYTGGVPTLISGGFGERRFSSAAAGSDGERYYISMFSREDGWGMYVYDIRRGIWLREDGTHACGFASALDGTLYCLDAGAGALTALGQEEQDEGGITWKCVLCRTDEGIPERKRYLRLLLRYELEAGGWLRVEAAMDGWGWRTVYQSHDPLERTAVIPLPDAACDSLRLRLSGRGRCLVRSLGRQFVTGGECG